MGVTPPPPLTESPLSFSGKIPLTKNIVFVLNKVKNGPKRAKNVWKKLNLKYLLCNGIGGYPPLNGKILLSSILRIPY